MSANKRFVLNMMARALVTAGAVFLLPAGYALLIGEAVPARSIGAVSLACIALGAARIAYAGSIKEAVRPRIWYMSTFFIWLMLCVVTVPAYFFGMPGSHLSDAVLSSCAGWTTTGLCVYETSSVPASLQLLRCCTSWLGGIGIIMVILTLVPSRQFIGFGLASTEFPGPTFLKTEASFRTGYKKIVIIYALLTLIHFILLMLAGMPVFTSALTALSNVSTAGLSHINGGIITELPGIVKAVIALFSLLGSVNCTLFLLIMERRLSDLKNRTELKTYAGRIIISAAVITCFVAEQGRTGSSVSKLFADSLMQMISFASTSGYIAADVRAWPVFCVMLVMVQMFIGGCAVSTGGGIKEARSVIAFKTMSQTIFRHVHPGSVRSLTFDGKPMKASQVARANLFIALFLMTWLIGALLLSVDDVTVGAALSYSQAAVTNTGISAAAPEMAGHPASLSAFSKYVMCILMLAGRLEIYPFIMLFLRSFWKTDRAV